MVDFIIKDSKKDNGRRVVVTGLGVVSSIGIGWQEFWGNLIKGKSGISQISLFDTSPYEKKCAGEIKNFHPHLYINRKKMKFIGRSSQFAIAASRLAVEDSNIRIDLNNKRTIVVVGLTMAEMTELERYNNHICASTESRNNLVALKFPARNVSCNIAKEFDVKGRNIVFSNACAAGNYSISYAYDQISNSVVDYALAGGSDGLSRVVFTGFNRLFAVADICQPFDKNRSGMIPAEGAAVLVLESLESALKRNARIYAEILGSGISSDAYHMTIPKATSVAKGIQKCLLNSRISMEDIDYICAHGTGTKENDEAEVSAVNTIFKQKSKIVPISSIKSMLGHTMGAASALETVACCLALKYQIIPPTINFVTKDPLCDVDCVPNQARKSRLKVVLNNSQAFGGNNACIALREF